MFGEATEHLYTDKQYPNKSQPQLQLVYLQQREISEHTGTYTHTCRHICAVCVVLIDLEVSGAHWRHHGRGNHVFPSDGNCGVTMALICNLLFCLCLNDRDFLRTRQRSQQYR